jgi:hypothetical protein
MVLDSDRNFDVLLKFVVHVVCRVSFGNGVIWMGHSCSFKAILELESCLATLNVDTLSLDMLRVQTNTRLILSSLSTTLDTTSRPLRSLVSVAELISLVFQWLEAVVDPTARVPNRYTVYHHNPYLCSLVDTRALLASMVEFWLTQQPKA